MTYTQADANALPEWPEPFDPSKQTLAQYLGNTVELAYERARSEAALARLRVAVEALQEMEGYWDVQRAEKALAAIGELPKE